MGDQQAYRAVDEQVVLVGRGDGRDGPGHVRRWLQRQLRVAACAACDSGPGRGKKLTG